MSTKRIPFEELSWDHLRYLLEVGRGGTLAFAARKLRVDQSTVSRRLSQLEFSAGATLFTRQRNGLVLTVLGRAMFDRVAKMEAELHALQGIASQGQDIKGCVRVASMEGIGSMLIAGAVTEFARQNPKIELNLITSSSFVDISRREADIFVSFFQPSAISLIKRQVAEVNFFLYAAPEYLRGRKIETLSDLGDDVFIGYVDDPVFLPSARWLEDIIPNAKIGFRATSMISQLHAAESGLGIVMLPPYARPHKFGLEPVLANSAYTIRSIWVSVQQDLQYLAHVNAAYTFLCRLLESDSSALLVP